MKAAIAFVGAIPPANGAPRDEFLVQRGRRAAGQASRAYLEAIGEIEQAMGPTELPPPASSAEDVDAQLRRWEPLRLRLAASGSNAHSVPGEGLARFALARAIEANYDLSESARASTAHARMHYLGQFVSGLYYCLVEWDEAQGLWFDRCAVALSHSGLGVSPGFTADLVCSICNQDAADCEHLPDSVYTATAERNEAGYCSICDESGCAHDEGMVYEVEPRSVFRNLDFHEGSLTPWPREPRARVTSIEVDPQPPPPRRQSSKRRCLQCLLACRGLPDRQGQSVDI